MSSAAGAGRPPGGPTGRRERHPLRLDADPQDVGRGLANLVVVVLELLREVLERQAIRRVDGGELTAEQVDELGQALIEIRRSLEQVRASLGVTRGEVDDALTRARRLVDPDTLAPGPAPEDHCWKKTRSMP